ncbi:SEA (Seh1-associated) complex subunit, partial [Cryomyces antarcticus]
MSPAQVATVLSTSHAHLNAAGLPAPQAEAILSAYHDQLHSLSFFNSAAYLRRLAYPAYPAVYEQALKDTQTSLRCQHCGNAINNPRNKMRCENCGERQAGCPVCGCERSPFEGGGRPNTYNHNNTNGSDNPPKYRNAHSSTPPPSNHPPQKTHDTASASPLLLTACLLCNHAAHSACLAAWHNPSPNTHLSSSFNDTDGGCPTPGCLCDCAAGTWRAAKALDKQQQQREARRRSEVENAKREKLIEGLRRGKGIGFGGRALSV